MKQERFRRILLALNRYIIFFLLIATVITVCVMLFVQVFTTSAGVTVTSENITTAAKLTFVNVLFLSALFTAIDGARRKITEERPVKKITAAAQKMMKGDFSVRIEHDPLLREDTYGEIVECMNTMAEELAGTETLRTDFIANVSHEIKTPLAVMQNYGKLLQQPQLSDAKRLEYAKAITEASRRLADLVSNILKLSKLENQQLLLQSEVYDLGEQLCECLLGFEDVWEQKQLNIETDIEDGIAVKTDRDMLSLVWNNLFSNAIKFTEEGGTVSLCVKSEGDLAVVRIKDTGCGISREVGARIFDKFYQGDTSHATQGNGLGLALVKRIIDITGSEIAVESEIGKGSTFTVKLRRVSRGTVQSNTP